MTVQTVGVLERISTGTLSVAVEATLIVRSRPSSFECSSMAIAIGVTVSI
jgi:hypothetical protein